MASGQPTTNARAKLHLTDSNGNQMQLIQETGNCQLNALSKFTINVPNFAITDGTDTVDDFLATRSADISTSTSADASLTTRLSTEETNRTSAVSTEASSRLSGDTSLSTVLSSEASSRLSGDTSLSTVLSSEASSRTSVDSSLETRVADEETNRASAVSTEASSRTSADTSMTTRLATLEGNVSAGIDWKAPVANIDDFILHDSTATVGDVRIVTDLKDAFLYVGAGNGENLTALNASMADKYIRFVDSNEIAANTTSIDTRISTEETNRSSTVSTESSSRTSADASLTTRLSNEEDNRSSAVSTEASSRLSGDTSLSTVLLTETSTRASADTSLTTRLSNEESTRTSADTSLTTKLLNEESTRTSADTSLTTRVVDEESTRSSAISTQASARASVETSLTSRLASLESSVVAGVDWKAPVANIAALVALDASASNGDVRVVLDQLDAFLYVGAGNGENLTALDATLADKYIRFVDSTEIATNTISIDTRVSTEENTRSTAISAESSSRTSADASLTTRLSNEEDNRSSAVSTEASSRLSGDTSLSTVLLTETSTRASADTSLTTRLSNEESTRTSADTSITTRVAAEELARSSAVSSNLSALISLESIINATFAPSYTEFNNTLGILDVSIQNINAYLISIGGEYSNTADTTERFIFIGTNKQYYAVPPTVSPSDWPNVQGFSAVNPDDEVWNFSYNNEWVIQNTHETTVDGRLYKDISNNSVGTTFLFELITNGTSKTNLSTNDFPFTDNKLYIDYNEVIGGHRIYQIYVKYNGVNHYLFVQQNDFSYNHASDYGFLSLIAENQITPDMKKATQFKINTNVATSS